jgi:transposase-like protein
MKKSRQHRTLEFKKEIVQQIVSGTAKASDLSRQHSIHPSLLNSWVRKFTSEGGLAPERGGFSELEKENQRLQAELRRYKEKVGEQALAIDFLKKFQEHVAKQKKSNGSVVSGKDWDPSKGRAK